MEGFLLLIIIILLIYIATTRKKKRVPCDNDSDDSEVENSKKIGCLRMIEKLLYAVLGICVLFFALVFAVASNSSGKDEGVRSTPRVTATSKPMRTTSGKDEGVSSTPRITATSKPTRTPKPTATPKPTPTPVPDFSSMSPESAASELAKYFAGKALDHKSTDVIEGGVCLEMMMKPFVTEKYAVVDCCKFALNVSEHLFKNQSVKSLVIYYDSEGRDAYGNETTVREMEILLYASTAKKINYDYMRDSLWTSTKRFLSITDRYYVHHDLSKGVYDK